MLLYILIAILIFGALILVHELGHFLTARLFHVKIYEFSIGMGPALIKKKGKLYRVPFLITNFSSQPIPNKKGWPSIIMKK